MTENFHFEITNDIFLSYARGIAIFCALDWRDDFSCKAKRRSAGRVNRAGSHCPRSVGKEKLLN